MFKSLTSALKIFRNLSQIKAVVETIYVSIVKTKSILEFITTQLNDTKLGKVLADYVPSTISLLDKVIQVFEKYGEMIGLSLDVKTLNISPAIEEINQLKGKLDELLK